MRKLVTQSRRGFISGEVMGLLIALAVLGALVSVETGAPPGGALAGSPDGSLNYDMGAGATQNPWIVLACHWPPTDPAAVAALQVPAPTAELEHFDHWVRGLVAGQWLPPGFPQSLPYLQGWGFVSIHETSAYRVRVREASKPAYSGANIITKGIVMAVEPLAGPIALPESEAAIMALLTQFLGPGVPISTAADRDTPRFILLPGARYLFRSPGSGGLSVLPDAIQLFAWTDGESLLLGFYEDAHYGSGPTPPRQVVPEEDTWPPEIPEELHNLPGSASLEGEAN